MRTSKMLHSVANKCNNEWPVLACVVDSRMNTPSHHHTHSQYSIVSLVIFSHFPSTRAVFRLKNESMCVCVCETCCDENRRCVTRRRKQTTRSTLLSADRMIALSCLNMYALGCYDDAMNVDIYKLRYAKVEVATITCCM